MSGIVNTSTAAQRVFGREALGLGEQLADRSGVVLSLDADPGVGLPIRSTRRTRGRACASGGSAGPRSAAP